MTEPTSEKHDAEDGANDEPVAAAAPGSDPTDTAHPTGEKQAAENADNEPAG